MGLIEWFSRKKPAQLANTKRPQIVGELGENSPQILVDLGNGTVMITDRETYEYTYGDVQAPDPRQRDLDEIAPRVTRVRAIASGLYRGRAMGSEVVVDTADPTALAALRAALRIVEHPAQWSRCACLGGPTVELYAGQELLASLGLQHGSAIRWQHWKHDAPLVNGQLLNDWLTEHGVEPALLDLMLHNQYDAGGLMGTGIQRGGEAPLSRAEQRVRLAEIQRVRTGDLAAALAACQRELDANPQLAFGYVIRAAIRQQQGDLNGAAADCTTAWDLGCRDPEVLFMRAVANDGLGRPDAAVADCTAAIELDPRHVNAYNSRGLILCRLGRGDEALADLHRAIELAPKWPLPYLNRVQLHINRQDLNAAIADCDHVLALVGDSQGAEQRRYAAAALWNRGSTHRLKGNLKQAEADFRAAVERDPT
jgi:tetratricopeptide (TPR) repeat protein